MSAKRFNRGELDKIRQGIAAGHHVEVVDRLMATIDHLEAKLRNAHQAIRLLSGNSKDPLAEP